MIKIEKLSKTYLSHDKTPVQAIREISFQMEDGEFRIKAVPPGLWTVVAYVTHGERYFAATAQAEPGKPVTIDLTRGSK